MPPALDHAKLRRSMEALMHSLSGDSTLDIFGICYHEIQNDGQDGEARPFFMLGRSLLRNCFKAKQPSTLEAKFALFRQIDSARPKEALENFPNFELFRKVPIAWNKMKSMDVPVVSLRAYEVIRETGNADNITDETRRDTIRYNRELQNYLKMALLFRHFDFQIDIAGFYRPPNLFLPSPANWTSEFSELLNIMDQVKMPLWTEIVNHSSQEFLRQLFQEFLNAANDFYERSRLNNVEYWINERREPYEMIERLNVYTEMARKIIALGSRVMKEQSKMICESQRDLATITSSVIDQ